MCMEPMITIVLTCGHCPLSECAVWCMRTFPLGYPQLFLFWLAAFLPDDSKVTAVQVTDRETSSKFCLACLLQNKFRPWRFSLSTVVKLRLCPPWLSLFCRF
jgi:hypothetical protein